MAEGHFSPSPRKENKICTLYPIRYRIHTVQITVNGKLLNFFMFSWKIMKFSCLVWQIIVFLFLVWGLPLNATDFQNAKKVQQDVSITEKTRQAIRAGIESGKNIKGEAKEFIICFTIIGQTRPGHQC
jgi:hypothetical protein